MIDKIGMLISLAITLVFLVLLLINSVKAREIIKSWFLVGIIFLAIIAWIVNFIRNFG